jgi:glyoxylase-like metal-dependent hydrolase (beta-lactamase superfamily II)
MPVPLPRWVALRALLALLPLLGAGVSAIVDAPRGAEQSAVRGLRLYVLDGGTLIYNNPETYNLTRQEVGNTNMSVPCYLVVHPRGTLLYDTGLGDRYLGRPFNQSTLGDRPNPPSTSYFVLVTRTLESQLNAIGHPAQGIDFLALSHPHGDHVGNANAFAGATWLVHQGDYDAMFGPGVVPASINPVYAALRNATRRIVEGDHDVFGDGTVVLKHTPGHTPGHQSLFVKLPGTGPLVLSGDLYHYPEERTLNRMPEREKSTATPASRAALEAFMKAAGAELWIGHDIGAYSRQKHAPEFYE